MDSDDEKEKMGGHFKTDRSSIHADIWYKFPFFPDIEAKVRMGIVDADKLTVGLDPSYREFRFELNYLF